LDQGKPILISGPLANRDSDLRKKFQYLLENYPERFQIYEIDKKDGISFSLIGENLIVKNLEGEMITVEDISPYFKSDIEELFSSLKASGATRGELLKLENRLHEELIEVEKYYLDFKWSVYTALIDIVFLSFMFVLAWLSIIKLEQLAISGLLLVILNMSVIAAKSYKSYSKRKHDWNRFGKKIQKI
jgi:hypothetical protein